MMLFNYPAIFMNCTASYLIVSKIIFSKLFHQAFLMNMFQKHLQFCNINLSCLCNTGMHQLEPQRILLLLNGYFFSITKVLASLIIYRNFFQTYRNYLSILILELNLSKIYPTTHSFNLSVPKKGRYGPKYSQPFRLQDFLMKHPDFLHVYTNLHKS